MSSVRKVFPWAEHVNYVEPEGGIMLMMKSLAQEVAPACIRVNSIALGTIRTPINRDACGTEEALGKLLTLIPYGRIGEPADVAKAAVWLASDESDYVTGTTGRRHLGVSGSAPSVSPLPCNVLGGSGSCNPACRKAFSTCSDLGVGEDQR